MVTSYRAAAEWVNREQARQPQPLRVLVAANGYSVDCFTSYLDARVQCRYGIAAFAERELPPEIDCYVATTRYGLHRNFPDSPVAWAEEADGVRLCVVRRRQGPLSAEAP